MMTAAVLYGREDVRIESLPIPPVGCGEVRVQIGAALTCGTDVKVFRRGYHARMIRPPAVFGHEFAGVIDATGPSTEGWQVGTRVIAANSAPCGACYFCTRRHPELCEDLLFLNGAYAQYITVPARIVARNLYTIPESLPFAHAALAEPLACVIHGMQSAAVSPGDKAVVLGLGPIGLMFVRMCVLAGACVIAVGKREDRIKTAAALGAAQVIDVEQVTDLVQSIRALTDESRGADTVIEAVGTVECWELAISMARNCGTVCLFGGCPAGSRASMDTHRVHYDQLRLVGSFHHTPSTFRAALDTLETGRLMPELFVKHSACLRDLPSVLSSLANGTSHAVKTAISMG